MYQCLEKAGGVVEDITWELFRETLIEQAEQVCACPACRGSHLSALLPMASTLTLEVKLGPALRSPFFYVFWVSPCRRAWTTSQSTRGCCCATSTSQPTASQASSRGAAPSMQRCSCCTAWIALAETLSDSASMRANKRT
jgi:hypothetical protein